MFRLLLNRLLGVCFWLCVALAAYVVLQVFVITSFRIPSDSMQPALLPGDRIWVDKLSGGARLFDLLGAAGNSPTAGQRGAGRGDGDLSLEQAPGLDNQGVRPAGGAPPGADGADGQHGVPPLPQLGELGAETSPACRPGRAHVVGRQPDNALHLPRGLLLRGRRQGPELAGFPLSQDSRYWGLLPGPYIVGRAWRVWWSEDADGRVRWDRVGAALATARDEDGASHTPMAEILSDDSISRCAKLNDNLSLMIGIQ